MEVDRLKTTLDQNVCVPYSLQDCHCYVRTESQNIYRRDAVILCTVMLVVIVVSNVDLSKFFSRQIEVSVSKAIHHLRLTTWKPFRELPTSLSSILWSEFSLPVSSFTLFLLISFMIKSLNSYAITLMQRNSPRGPKCHFKGFWKTFKSTCHTNFNAESESFLVFVLSLLQYYKLVLKTRSSIFSIFVLLLLDLVRTGFHKHLMTEHQSPVLHFPPFFNHLNDHWSSRSQHTFTVFTTKFGIWYVLKI